MPSKKECEEDIFGEMVRRCVVSASKEGAAVNVRMLPTEWSVGEGVRKGRGRFLVAGGRVG